MSLVRDLPAYGGLGEGGYTGGVAAGDLRHGGEGLEDIGGFGPDGNVLHGVVKGHLGLVEAVGHSGRGEMIDGVGHAVAIAEAWRITGAEGGDGVAADVDGHLYALIQQLRFNERVHLGGLFGIAGLVRETDIGEQAIGVIDVVLVEPLDEVLRCGGGLGMASGERQEKGAEECGVQ